MSYIQAPGGGTGPSNGNANNNSRRNGSNPRGNPFERGGNNANGGANGGDSGKRSWWQSPWLWVVVLVVLSLVGVQMFAGTGTQTLDTRDGMNILYGAIKTDGTVDSKRADRSVLPYRGVFANPSNGSDKSKSDSKNSDSGDGKSNDSGNGQSDNADKNKSGSDTSGNSDNSDQQGGQGSDQSGSTDGDGADGSGNDAPASAQSGSLGDESRASNAGAIHTAAVPRRNMNGYISVERATIIDNGQQVKLKLSADFRKKDPKTGRNHNYGRDVQFYYTQAQETQVVEAVRLAQPKNGWTTNIATDSVWTTLLIQFLPLVLFIVLLYWMFSKMSNASSGMFGMGGNKNNGKLLEGETPTTKFADVAGEQSAVEEVQEIKDFLKDPSKYNAIGARIPRGVLLYGPPGTGKTLLARAIAGEAGVPFYAMAGSDFVEMFVGLGASRVRDLFEEAKKNAPAIIFIDEIDAVGRKRGSGMNGGHDEREQTLNQLLVEMDGFDNDTNLIIIAATNRPDVLDSALLRPGRFDRQVAVEAPDLEGREAILKVHAKGKPFVPDVDLHTVAVRTPGFTGADLANVLNEAALLCARAGAQLIDNRAIDEAIDRVQAGPRRQSRSMALDEMRNTAYHEGGHAMVAAALHHTDPVTKVTILPRGQALGYTAVMPTSDRYSQSRYELLDQMAYAMGGRTAEEVVFHDPTTGASNDIEKATKIARTMVMEYGLSSKLGAVKWGVAEPDGESVDAFSHKYSEKTGEIIDEEVHNLVEEAHTEAWNVINENRDVLDELVRQLLVKETLNEKELADIFKNLRKAPERELWLSDAKRTDSDLPPVPIPESLRKSVGER